MSFIVAIDGPAGTGKGTIAKLMGEKMGLVNIDTGAMFRCVTLAMLNQGIGLEEEEKIEKLLEEIKIELRYEDEKQIVLLDGEDVTMQIRSNEVNNFVSPVSTLALIRTNMLNLQRKMAEGKNVIMEGRDIGTTVFPDANVKIYLDASSEERAKRRVKQNEEKGIPTSYDEALKNIEERDKVDSQRTVSPLKKAEDAIVVDSTTMTIEEVEHRVEEIINKKLEEQGIILDRVVNNNEIKEDKSKTKEIRKFKGSKEFDKSTDSWWKKVQRRCVWVILRGFYKIFYRLEVKGIDNVPNEGGFIICGNHVDFVKVPVIVLFTPRKVNFIAKAELFNNSVLAWLAGLFDVISVKRGKQDLESMKNSLRVLSKGEGLGLFPEGTRNGMAKKIKVKNGAAFMALRTGKPILPVGVKVTKGPFSKIILNFGAPLDYSQYQTKSPEKETLEKVTEEMMNTIINLTNQ